MKRGLALTLLALTLAAVFLRWPLLERQGLWADEVFSLAIATGHSLEHPAAAADPELGDFVESAGPQPASAWNRYMEHDQPPASLGRVLRATLLSDTSPPLYYLLLHGWTRALGTSDASLRGFSLAWALASLPLLVLLARLCGGRRTAIAAVLVFAAAPMSVYYSTEGRMYSLLWACTLAATLGAVALQRFGPRPWLLVLWTSASAAGLLTHYFFAFVLAALALVLVLTPGRLPRRWTFATAAVIGLAVLPWYVQLPESLSSWRITQGWLEWRPGGFGRGKALLGVMESFLRGRGTWGGAGRGDKLALLLVAGALGLLAWRLRTRALARGRLFLWASLGAACLGPLVFDVLRGTYTIAVQRYALAGLPAAVLLTGLGFARLGAVPRTIALAVLVAAWSPGLRQMIVNPSRSGCPMREAARDVERRCSDDDLVLVHAIPSGLLGVTRYLERPLATAVWVGQLRSRTIPRSLVELARGRTRIVLVRIHEVGEPAVEEELLRDEASVVKERTVESVHIVEFQPRDEPTFFLYREPGERR